MKRTWKLFLTFLFRPLWSFVTGLILNVIALLTFFWPDLQPLLSWPRISEIMQWYYWLILGLVVWLVSVAWSAAKQSGSSERGAAGELIEAKEQSVAGGQTAQQGTGNVSAGRDVIFGSPPRNDPIELPVLPVQVPKALSPNPNRISIIPNARKPSRYGHQEDIRFIVKNDTGSSLTSCHVHLEEIGRSPVGGPKGEWDVLDGLPSADPLHWIIRFEPLESIQCRNGIQISPGGREAFILVRHEISTRYPKPGEQTVSFTGYYRYCDHWDEELNPGFDYRLRLQFTATGMKPVNFYVFLSQHEDGFWEFHHLERIED